eukprot:1061573-Alexandrium_andersonii.AAC.1
MRRPGVYFGATSNGDKGVARKTLPEKGGILRKPSLAQYTAGPRAAKMASRCSCVAPGNAMERKSSFMALKNLGEAAASMPTMSRGKQLSK